MIGVSHDQLSCDELVVVSGSYGWQPMRPALFAVMQVQFRRSVFVEGASRMVVASLVDDEIDG